MKITSLTGPVPAAAAALLCTIHPAAAQNSCDPRNYGATNDGKTDNTVVIQRALDDCGALGGGIVPITGGGTYITGPISLGSHVYLKVDGGTTLKNTNDHSRYQPAFIGYPFQFKNNPAQTGAGPNLPGLPEAMISGSGITDAGIIGTGTIDGSGADPAADGGKSWWQLAADANTAKAANPSFIYTDNYNPQGYADIPTSNGQPRPWLIEFYNSQSVTVNGITVTNSPMWCLGLRYVVGAQVANYIVRNPSDSPNTDGIDPVGATDLTVINADIDTGADNIAIKSGLPGIPADAYYNAPYNLPRQPTSRVTVLNSTFRRGHGLSIGSETYNGVNTIRANNITFLGTDNGFRIKTGRDRGNQIYGMTITNLTMTDVPTPLSLSMYYPTVPTATQGDVGPATATTTPVGTTEPYVHDISISGVTVSNPKTVRNSNVGNGLMLGLPESQMYNVTLNNISIATASSSGGTIRVRNLNNDTCTNVTVATTAGTPLPAFSIDQPADHVNNSQGCSP